MQEQTETPPWEQAKSHSRLWIDRANAATKAEQNELAPKEHKAFAKELVAEKPWMAPSLAVAIPAYQVAKSVLGGSRSDPSMTQVTEAYKGIGEGLTEAASKPWEIAKEWARRLLQGEKMPSQPLPTVPSRKPPTEHSTAYPTEVSMKKAMLSPEEAARDKAREYSQANLMELTQEIARTKDPKIKKILKDYQTSLKGKK